MSAHRSLTTAQLLVQCLENEGVEYVFGIPGEENIRLVDAMKDSHIRFITVRDERAASFMADLYGRVTGKPGVCAATLGPGAINLLLGTADALTSSTPLVAISAQVGLNRIHKETHQIIDLLSVFKPVTKWAEMIVSSAAVPEMVRQAFKKPKRSGQAPPILVFPKTLRRSRASLASAHLSVPTSRTPCRRPGKLRAADVLRAATTPIAYG